MLPNIEGGNEISLLPSRLKAERTLPNSFHEVSLTLVPKPDTDIKRKENCTPVSLINIGAAILNKILTNGL